MLQHDGSDVAGTVQSNYVSPWFSILFSIFNQVYEKINLQKCQVCSDRTVKFVLNLLYM